MFGGSKHFNKAKKYSEYNSLKKILTQWVQVAFLNFSIIKKENIRSKQEDKTITCRVHVEKPNQSQIWLQQTHQNAHIMSTNYFFEFFY